MAQDRHADKYVKGKFCARVPCKHHDYRSVCKGSPTFAQKADVPGGAIRKKFEAHHLLCWSPVTGLLFTKQARSILKGTEWCVNSQTNMLAMPMFGHTVQWYTSRATRNIPPPFMNIPHHDFDHNIAEGYTIEVERALTELVGELQEAKDDHNLPKPADIASMLDAKSKNFRAKLRGRGLRSGGTHLAWLEAPKKWYLPFSMALAAKIRSPRIFKDERDHKLQMIKEAQELLRGG